MSFGLPGGISIGGSLFTSHSHALMDDWDLLFNLIEYFFEERERRRERERERAAFLWTLVVIHMASLITETGKAMVSVVS